MELQPWPPRAREADPYNTGISRYGEIAE